MRLFVITIVSVLLGALLDFVVGDPRNIPHPIMLIGRLISFCERTIRKEEKDSPFVETVKGLIMWVIVVLLSALCPGIILFIAYTFSTYIYGAVSTFMCCQIMATKSLRDESMKVYYALRDGSIEDARVSVSMIVGRDTRELSGEGVIKATVETIAENTTDGCIAPYIYMLLFGAVGGFIYKAVNTMDSMVGYKNDKYINFGRIPARMDDVFNYIPARIAAVLMILAAGVVSLTDKQNYYGAGNAFRIFMRDRNKSKSPNSAQTESVCAGALGVELLGDAVYFGKIYKKPKIGDKLRKIEELDIKRANILMYLTVIFGIIILTAMRLWLLL